MTLYNPQAYLAAAWDWGCFDECFTRGARISDIDGVIDCDGHVCVIEAKPVGHELRDGQLRVFGALARLGVKVFIVYGKPGCPEFCQVVWPDGLSPMYAVDLETMREALRVWWKWADSHPAPNRLWRPCGGPWEK